jgi:rSAM/selenodomain-associated transferase 1
MSAPSAPRRVLALFAKAPTPGLVKTRLSPPLSAQQAAELYEAMLEDILDQARDARDCARALWFWPETARAYFARFESLGFALHAQQGPDLPARMAHLFRAHAAEGFERIVLRGTDSPTLPAARIAEAFAALERAPLVLCPDRDGGYNLIGQRGPCDALFELELSHAGVLAQTLARARALGLRVDLLPAHHDVDTFADLALLRGELDPRRTPRTLRFLATHRLS